MCGAYTAKRFTTDERNRHSAGPKHVRLSNITSTPSQEVFAMPESRLSLRLSRLPHELEQAGFRCDELPPYRRLWQDAVERRFPAHQERNVWHFFQDDVPTISAAYRLKYNGAGSANHTNLGDRRQQKIAL
jgi:hypothetical protein